jgi:hypothetical protein
MKIASYYSDENTFLRKNIDLRKNSIYRKQYRVMIKENVNAFFLFCQALLFSSFLSAEKKICNVWIASNKNDYSHEEY